MEMEMKMEEESRVKTRKKRRRAGPPDRMASRSLDPLDSLRSVRSVFPSLPYSLLLSIYSRYSVVLDAFIGPTKVFPSPLTLGATSSYLLTRVARCSEV